MRCIGLGRGVLCSGLANSARLGRQPRRLQRKCRRKRNHRPLASAFAVDCAGVCALQPDDGVTTALTTDVPAIPLFWVLPLAIYLLSFVLVFARRQLIPHEWPVRRLPFFILATLIPGVCKIQLPLLTLILLYLITLFAVALVCHGELAAAGRALAALLSSIFGYPLGAYLVASSTH